MRKRNLSQRITRSLVSFIPVLAILGILGEICRPVARAQAQQNSGSVRCQELKRQGEWPEYTNSGVWSEDGKKLFLLDNARRRLLEFSVSGKSEGVVYGELAKRLALGDPRSITPIKGGGFYIQTDENRFTAITGKALKDFVADRSPSGLGFVSKIYNFTVVGDEVVAFADVEESPDQFQRGFIVFPKVQPSAFRWLKMRISNAERTFFRLSFPYIATVGDTAYVLRMETKPELYSYKRGNLSLTPVDAFNTYAEGHLLPQLPEFRMANFELLMRTVERSRMPVGLYGWGSRLFLLERSWTGKTTNWRFVVINPEVPGAKLASIPIGVNAEHLFAVPGNLRWSLVMKGQLTGLLSQKVTGIRFFPSAVLQTGATLPAQICN
jgi:hypothetical protein